MTQIPNLVNLFSWGNIIVYMLVFTRLTGLIQSAPFLSTIKAPVMAKLWFAATIAFIFYPIVKASNAFILPSNMVEFGILLSSSTIRFTKAAKFISTKFISSNFSIL